MPLTVNFNGNGSTDPDGDTLSYAWDLDGDGDFDDSTAVQPSFTYTQTGSYEARLRVRDPSGLTGTDAVTITVGAPPSPTIATPTAGTTWAVRDVIDFSGSATRSGGGNVPASGLSWTLIMHHCSALVPTNCHEHQIQTYPGVASERFTAPDHEYPSYLSLELTATDGGLSSTVSRRLDPKTVNLSFETNPAGLQLSVGSEEQTAPFTRTVIQGSSTSLIAPPEQTLNGRTLQLHVVVGRRCGGAQGHGRNDARHLSRELHRGHVRARREPRGRVGLRRDDGHLGHRRVGPRQHRDDQRRHAHGVGPPSGRR